MEDYKISKLSNDQYSVNKNKNIRFKTLMLRSDLCDYGDPYIVVKRTIGFLANAANENNKAPKNVAFKNNAPFRLCVPKVNSILKDNAEDLDIVMPIYNL